MSTESVTRARRIAEAVVTSTLLGADTTEQGIHHLLDFREGASCLDDARSYEMTAICDRALGALYREVVPQGSIPSPGRHLTRLEEWGLDMYYAAESVEYTLGEWRDLLTLRPAPEVEAEAIVEIAWLEAEIRRMRTLIGLTWSEA